VTGAQILIGRCVREIGLLALYYSAQYVRRRAPADIPRSAMRCRRSRRRLWRREMKLHRSQLHLVVSRQLLLVTPPSPPPAEYCDQRVCVSACSRAYLRNYTSDLRRIIGACYPCLWLGPPLSSLQRYVMYYRFCG